MKLSLIREGLGKENVHSEKGKNILNPPCIIDGLLQKKKKKNLLNHSALIRHYHLYP